MADSWKVFQCTACNNCHGGKSSGHKCPHCGQKITELTLVVDYASSAAELRNKVIIANTPNELKESLSKKLANSKHALHFNEPFSPAKGLKLLRDLAAENGTLSLALVDSCFEKNGFNGDIDEFMQLTEMEGFVIRVGEGIWQFLE